SVCHHMVVRSTILAATMQIVALRSLPAQEPGAHNSLRIGLLTGGDRIASRVTESASRGVRLGAAEARQTSQLFGSDVELFETVAGTDAAGAAQRLLSEKRIQVLIGASARDVDALSRFAEANHVLFLNVVSRSQALRLACRRHTFHVEATDIMYANAARSLTRSSVFAALSAAPIRPDSVVLWAAGLQRYGAGQINDRYQAHYHMTMDGAAWAGWIAVKIAAEASLRTRSTEPEKLLAYLESPNTEFDGHKGWPLSFRLADHQLRQPLYAALPVRAPARERHETLRDVPELRDVGTAGDSAELQSPSQALDRLMAGKSASRCPWVRH
ncbi:MAG: ABC transporter substrate-binding protein, partial [Gemmatimonadaceae bacterium]